MKKRVTAVSLLICLLAALSCEKHDVPSSKPPYSQEDVTLSDRIGSYLSGSYECHVTSVAVSGDKVTVSGVCGSGGELRLGEFPPYTDIFGEDTPYVYVIDIADGRFEAVFDRKVEREGFIYDRALSKWAVLKVTGGRQAIASHARYADEIHCSQALPPMNLRNKKGMGGIVNYGTDNEDKPIADDLKDFDVSSGTVNIVITHFMSLEQKKDYNLRHEYGGRAYWFNESYLVDWQVKYASDMGIVLAGILLVDHKDKSSDVGQLLKHPDNNGGTYTMPDMTTPEAVNCYAAALDFLAQRYSRPDGKYGRICHWIMHNEVDSGMLWTNMGYKPASVYTETYIKSMRMCYNIARQYDANAQVFASFTHSWTAASYTNDNCVRDILDCLVDFSHAEGDFQWGGAHHSYPWDLGNPFTWKDVNVTFSMDTPYVTFYNLEVLHKWAWQKENMYKGRQKRSIWLSEAGVSCRSYSEKDMMDQAAGFAFAWKKISGLSGIDGIQWHNWVDNPDEGFSPGFRKNIKDFKGEKKPIWDAYYHAGTDEENEFFKQYLPIIGISDWNIIEEF